MGLFFLYSVICFSVAQKFVINGYNRFKVRVAVSLIVGLGFVVLMEIVSLGASIDETLSDQIFLMLLMTVVTFLASYGKGNVDLLDPIDTKKVLRDFKNIKRSDIKEYMWLIVSVVVIPLAAIGLPFLILYLISG